MASVQPNDVRALVAQLADLRAPDTLKGVYLTLKEIMATAEIDLVITRSPCLGIKLPPQTSREEMHFLSTEPVDQVAQLAEAITPRFRVPIYAAAWLGARDGELWAIRIENLDLLRGKVTIAKSLAEVRKGTVLPPRFEWVAPGLVLGPTKTGKTRILDIPKFLIAMLAEHIAKYPPSPEGFIFTATEGGPVRHRNFYRRHFLPAVAGVGTLPEGLRFHDYADLRVMRTSAMESWQIGVITASWSA